MRLLRPPDRVKYPVFAFLRASLAKVSSLIWKFRREKSVVVPADSKIVDVQLRIQLISSSPLLRLPQELKDQIWEFVLGGNAFHVHTESQTHGCRDPNISVAICRAPIPNEETQENFDEWTSAMDFLHCDTHRHSDCCKAPGQMKPVNQHFAVVSSAIQRSETSSLFCNTFSFSEPMVLLNFVAKVIQSGASPAIRSIHLHMFIKRYTDVDAWRRAFRMVSKELTGLQNVFLMVDQGVEPARHIGYVVQHYGQLDLGEFAEVDERWWTSLLASLDKLQKLPLKKATFVISGKGLEVRWGNLGFWQTYQQSEMEYRWTLEEKRAWAKDVRQVILRQKSSSVA